MVARRRAKRQSKTPAPPVLEVLMVLTQAFDQLQYDLRYTLDELRRPPWASALSRAMDDLADARRELVKVRGEYSVEMSVLRAAYRTQQEALAVFAERYVLEALASGRYQRPHGQSQAQVHVLPTDAYRAYVAYCMRGAYAPLGQASQDYHYNGTRVISEWMDRGPLAGRQPYD